MAYKFLNSKTGWFVKFYKVVRFYKAGEGGSRRGRHVQVYKAGEHGV